MPVKSDTSTERLFREIAAHEELSLGALSRTVHLKVPSLARKLQPLVKRGAIVLGKGRRKFGINPEYGHVVVIDLGASHLHFALGDFRGEIRSDLTVKIRPEDGPQKMIQQIKESARELALKAGHGRLQAIAIGVPSPVDAEHGVVTFANNLIGWKDIHLAHELQREFRVPVFMENDANMAAIGEHWRGVARGVDNFVFIAIGTGIGSGVFVNGKLYRGRTGSAGELYKMNIDWQSWNEEFPDTGQFESYVSGMGIAAEARKAMALPSQGEATSVAQERDAYFVFQSFREGSPQARAALEKIFIMLGVGVANVIGILDPDLIVLGGGITKGAPQFMLETVEKVAHRIQPSPPPIRFSSLEDKAQTYGAIWSALDLAYEAVARHL